MENYGSIINKQIAGILIEYINKMVIIQCNGCTGVKKKKKNVLNEYEKSVQT